MPSPPLHGAEVVRLLRPYFPWIMLSVSTGLVAGAATVALLATINQSLHHPGGMAGETLLIFVALCVIALVGRGASDISTNHVGQRLVVEVRKTLAQKILTAPIETLERYRAHRLMPVLTHDIDMISSLAFTLASTLISVAITTGCLAYLAVLSPLLFGMLLVALVAGTAIQSLAQARGMQGFWAAREHEESLHKAYRSLSEGAKELRLHRGRRQHLFEQQIVRTVHAIRDVNSRAVNTYVLAKAFGAALFFLLIGLILGWAALRAVEPDVLSGFVLVLLFLKGPIEQIATALPSVGRSRVAFRRIADLSARFASPEPHLLPTTAFISASTPTSAPPALQHSIELRGVCYAFDDVEGGGQRFGLGPIDLRLSPGELVFIVGDNGSGKTTLIKLLLGLYEPQQGQVLLDGQPVTRQTRDDYRQLFTTVFSDFHLFDGVLAGEQGRAMLDQAAQPYLEKLEIAHKVHVQNGVFSTTDLSTGQRKRLALVHAYLEGRPVLVFDEWAADQDPSFRRLFYTELLPDLRARGHLLVVISHDDRYFYVADRVLRMRTGRLEPAPNDSSVATE